MQNTKKTCAGCFRVLADATRMGIIKHLQEGGAQNVSALTKLLRVSQPTVSHHLHRLADAGYVTRTRLGKQIRYEFRKDYPCRGCGVFSAPIRS